MFRYIWLSSFILCGCYIFQGCTALSVDHHDHHPDAIYYETPSCQKELFIAPECRHLTPQYSLSIWKEVKTQEKKVLYMLYQHEDNNWTIAWSYDYTLSLKDYRLKSLTFESEVLLPNSSGLSLTALFVPKEGLGLLCFFLDSSIHDFYYDIDPYRPSSKYCLRLKGAKEKRKQLQLPLIKRFSSFQAKNKPRQSKWLRRKTLEYSINYIDICEPTDEEEGLSFPEDPITFVDYKENLSPIVGCTPTDGFSSSEKDPTTSPLFHPLPTFSPSEKVHAPRERLFTLEEEESNASSTPLFRSCEVPISSVPSPLSLKDIEKQQTLLITPDSPTRPLSDQYILKAPDSPKKLKEIAQKRGGTSSCNALSKVSGQLFQELFHKQEDDSKHKEREKASDEGAKKEEPKRGFILFLWCIALMGCLFLFFPEGKKKMFFFM